MPRVHAKRFWTGETQYVSRHASSRSLSLEVPNLAVILTLLLH